MLKYRLTLLFAVTAMLVMLVSAAVVNAIVSNIGEGSRGDAASLGAAGNPGVAGEENSGSISGVDNAPATLLWTMVATTGGLFIVLFGFVFVADLAIYRSGRREIQQAEEARQTLEERVAQRTQELRESNNQLVEAQEHLVEAEKLAALGRLAGGVAHDFNNLLTPIIGYAQLSLMKEGPNEDLRSTLEEILKDADRAASLTQQLLAFSRRQIIEPKVVDLNGLVAQVSTLLQRSIGEDINLTTAPATSRSTVKVDPGQMEQVLVNLAVNARDAMPDGGQLSIAISSVTLDQSKSEPLLKEIDPGDYVTLTVADTGTGMPEEIKAHIFEPFFTTKEVGKGTGLGLSTCYGIVKQNGGHLTVWSEPGQGTTFTIFLPLLHCDEIQVDEPRDIYDLPFGQETVLLAEDEPSVRGLASLLLREQGYLVLEAANGVEALDVAQEYNRSDIHLLLTDVVMPQMGGRELADQLELIHPETRVLFISGYTDDAIVRHGVLNPGTQFIQKPFTPPSLARKVREVLDKQPQELPAISLD